MLLNKRLAIDNSLKRGWQMANSCILCQRVSESVKHIFNECTFSKVLYVDVAHMTSTLVHMVLVPIEGIISLQNTEKELSILLSSQFMLW